MTVEQIIEHLIGVEGGYSNNPNDAGGETNWGITYGTARAHQYFGAMKDMPREAAARIYREQYFVAPRFDKVYELSQPLAVEMFDTGVNMGTSVPVIWLQRILNALNQQGKLYADIEVDGKIGPATIGALRSFLRRRATTGEKVLVRALNCMQGARYLDITEKRPANESFFYGWLLNRVSTA